MGCLPDPLFLPWGGRERQPIPKSPVQRLGRWGEAKLWLPLTRFSTVSTMSRLLTSPTWMSPIKTANFMRMLRMGTDGLIIPAGSTTDPELDALSSPITAAAEPPVPPQPLLLPPTPPPLPPPPPPAAATVAPPEPPIPPPPLLLAPTAMSPAGCGSGPDTGFSLAIYPRLLPTVPAAATTAAAALRPGREAAHPPQLQNRSSSSARRGRRERTRPAAAATAAASEGPSRAPLPRSAL